MYNVSPYYNCFLIFSLFLIMLHTVFLSECDNPIKYIVGIVDMKLTIHVSISLPNEAGRTSTIETGRMKQTSRI